MNYRTIGNSELRVSEIGLGCMSLGTDETRAISIIDEAIELGVNYLDTADLYDFGVNEEIVGKAIQTKRQQLILATKVGNRWNSDSDGWNWDPSKKYIKEAVKKSLLRLQTDYIDLYQLHGGTIEDNIDETIEAFEDLQTEGVIRYYGISSIRPNVVREFAKKSTIVSVMMQYSILDQRPEEEVFKLLHSQNISVIARGPLAKGLLTNNGNEKVTNSGYMHLSTNELTKALEDLSTTFPNRTLQELAFGYCLANPTVAAVLPGASRLSQIRDNVKAALSTPLTDTEVNVIKQLVTPTIYKQHR